MHVLIKFERAQSYGSKNMSNQENLASYHFFFAKIDHTDLSWKELTYTLYMEDEICVCLQNPDNLWFFTKVGHSDQALWQVTWMVGCIHRMKLEGTHIYMEDEIFFQKPDGCFSRKYIAATKICGRWSEWLDTFTDEVGGNSHIYIPSFKNLTMCVFHISNSWWSRFIEGNQNGRMLARLRPIFPKHIYN